MSFKVFRLHTAASTGTDWHESKKISAAEIDSIKDPADAHHSVPVTSIPTPFARIFLLQDAFAKINQQALLNSRSLFGDSSHHKLISDLWDLAQLMFSIESLKSGSEQIEIIRWDKDEQLSELRSSYQPEHQLVARTLELFWKDAFGEQKQLYIIVHNHKVIGGTSPRTLFFTNPNDDNFSRLKHGDDTLFDGSFHPLHSRDAAFVRFIYLLFEAFPKLKSSMGLVYEYLNISKTAIQNPELKNELMGYGSLGAQQALSKLQGEYEVSTVAGAGTDIWLLPGINLYKQKAQSAAAAGAGSDFMIGCYQNPNGKNSKSKRANLPLVLQNNFHNPYSYWGGKWAHTTQVPYYEPASLDERRLPSLSVKYPYLTVSDFLEAHLLELPFKADEKRFFNGNAKGFKAGNKSINETPDNSFLLPIKKEFFEYFNTSDLMTTLPDGKKVLEMEKLNEQSVRVTLRVPIQAANQYLTFERVYYRDTQPDLNQNKGAISSARLNVGFFPFLNNPSVKNKRFALLEQDDNKQLFEVKFFQNERSEYISPTQTTVSSDMSKGHFATSRFMHIDERVDYLELSKHNQTGLLLPIYPAWHQGGKTFTFAVDFGTTNSHIEYAVDGGAPKGFDITEKDVQLVTLDDRSWQGIIPELQNYFLYEMIPFEIGGEFSLPTRTALAETQNLNFMGALMSFGDFNPAFYYEKYKLLPQYNLITKLKWSIGLSQDAKDNSKAEKRIEAYIESLLMLIKNKVLLNEGNPANTQIIWFAPSSMGGLSLNLLTNTWNTLHQRHFPAAPKPIKYSESDSPYYHGAARAMGIRPSVSIDIGGGSSDVVIFNGNKPQLLTSFRFAGGALFGTGYYQEPSLDNGFVQRFKPQVELFFNENYYSLLPLLETFEQISNPQKGNAADLMSFFFSLDNNATLKKNKLEFKFTSLLQKNTDFKILYFLFYGAIQYHIATLMKTLGMEMPQHIFFSGNGSKVINLLDISDDWNILSKLTGAIFSKIYEQPLPEDGLQLHKNPEPKAATCKGGIIKHNQGLRTGEIPIFALLGDEKQQIADDGMSFHNFSNKTTMLTYQEVQNNLSEYQQGVVNEVRKCFKLLLLEMPRGFANNLGIPIAKLQDYYNALDYNLAGYLQAGLTEQIKMASTAATVSESLFFYPVVGALHDLGLKIANNRI